MNAFQWPINHPVAFSMILFLLSAVVSIYGPDIKRFIQARPHKFKQYNQRLFSNDLALLQWLRNNPYNLSLYFYSQVIGAVTAFFLWYMGFAALDWLSHSGPTPMANIIFGITVGTAFRMRRILSYLYSYEDSVKDLERRAGVSEKSASVQAGS
jgi:hypothetical protein